MQNAACHIRERLRHGLPWTMFTVGLALLVPCATAADNPPDDVSRLISLAGNAGDDPACRDYLKQLRDLPGLDPKLQAEADRLISEIGRWMTSPYLPYFGNEVLKKEILISVCPRTPRSIP